MFNKKLVRPPKMKDDILWDLLTKMLTFDRKDRISAEEILQHEFFTGEQAINYVSEEAKNLIAAAQIAKLYNNKNITQYDTNTLFILPFSEINQYLSFDFDADNAQIQQQIIKPSPFKKKIIQQNQAGNPFVGALTLTSQPSIQELAKNANKQQESSQSSQSSLYQSEKQKKDNSAEVPTEQKVQQLKQSSNELQIAELFFSEFQFKVDGNAIRNSAQMKQSSSQSSLLWDSENPLIRNTSKSIFSLKFQGYGINMHMNASMYGGAINVRSLFSKIF
ncbi:MAG: hypothetical protein EZS28_042674, partial [Streblomastix strix]